jgi:deoxyribose-phosphate aldolase
MELNKYIDHTLLKPDAGAADIDKLCAEAKAADFTSVCVNPVWVERAAHALQDSDVKVCTVIGFPLGATTSAVKSFEGAEAIANGAEELDMVINIGALKDKHDEFVKADIAGVVEVAAGHIVKVILETALLTDEEIVRASTLAVAAGAKFVKTSTGFSSGGASVEAVRLMKQTVGDAAEVKASGGVRTLEDMQAMIAAGASRIGTSNAVAILADGVSTSNY